jgi:hypothetical protein
LSNPRQTVRRYREGGDRRRRSEEDAVKYALLIYTPEEARERSTPEAVEEMYKRYATFGKEFGDRITGGEELQSVDSATTVRLQGGPDGEVVTTDGPFAETKEQLAGFYLVEAADLDEAIQVAARVPSAAYGSVEVRPVAPGPPEA